MTQLVPVQQKQEKLIALPLNASYLIIFSCVFKSNRMEKNPMIAMTRYKFGETTNTKKPPNLME